MKKWRLQEVLFLALIAFLFGAIFMGAGVLYALLTAVLTPLGYGPFANEILFGLWTMAAPVAGMLVRRPGSAVLGEVLAALAEMLYGSYFGPGVLVSGLLQGAGTELGFLAGRYRCYDSRHLLIGAVGTTVLSFLYEFFKFGYGVLGVGMVVSLLIVRLLSVIFFGVILVQAIMKLYDKVQQLAVTRG